MSGDCENDSLNVTFLFPISCVIFKPSQCPIEVEIVIVSHVAK